MYQLEVITLTLYSGWKSEQFKVRLLLAQEQFQSSSDFDESISFLRLYHRSTVLSM